MNKKLISVCVAYAIGSLGASVALAQNGPEASTSVSNSNVTSLEEIVVTARKKNESIMEIPLSVSVVNRQKIEAASIASMDDLARTTPGFKVNSAFGRQGDRPVVRGVSGISTRTELAGYFVDGVYVSGTLQSFDFDSIERVEILKGPQSAAFGRRTFAGAVNYVTQLPSEEPLTKINVELGSNSHQVLGATFSGTSGSVGYRANIRHFSYDGDFNNTLASGPQNVGGQESTSFNGTLYFQPSESTSIRANIVIANDDDEQYAIALQRADNNNCQFGVGRPRPYYCGELIGSTPVSLGGVYSADQYGTEQDRLRTSLHVEHDFGNMQLTSITGYNKTDYMDIADQTFGGIQNEFSFAAFTALPAVAGEGFHSFNETETTNFSQELWLRGDAAAERLEWAVGAYYFDEEERDLEAGGGQDEVQNIALMGSLDYSFSDKFKAGLELRYAEDEVDQITDGSGSLFNETFDSLTYRLSGSWFVSDDSMIYGNISTGTLPGFFNTDGRLPVNLIPVDESELTQIELGIKSQVSDSFEYTAAVYSQEWKDQTRSQFLIVDGTPVSYQANQGTTDFLGLELSATWRASDKLTFTGAVSLNDSEVNDFISDDATDVAITGDGDVSGAQAPLSPDSEAYFSGAYDFEVGNGYNLTARVDWSYQASRYVRLVNLAETGDASIVNATLTLTPPENDWRVAIWGKNLTDEDSPVSGLRYIEADSFFFGARAFAITPRRGTEFGVTATYSF